MSVKLPTIASCPRCGTIVYEVGGALVHPTSGERETLRKALGHYWFAHSRTKFDGRFHRCPDRDALDLEVNRRPCERVIGRRMISSTTAHLRARRYAWIMGVLVLLMPSSMAFAMGPQARAGRSPTSMISLEISTHGIREELPSGESESMSSWVGREVSSGRYEVLEVIAEGPAGTSFRARDRKLGHDVLIEVPHAPSTARTSFVEHFRDGVRHQSLLEHAHLVKVLAVGVSDGWPYAVSEYPAGGSLKFRREIGRDGRPAPGAPQALSSWLADVANVLDYLHQSGQIHRDLRPTNIVFDDQGHAYLGGLGMSEAISAASAEKPAPAQNLANLTFGAPGYMAPEQAAGTSMDGQADQYALAAIVYEFLSGQLPYEGHSAMAVLIQQLTREPLDLHRLRPEISEELAGAVRRGLSREPRDRYPDCRSFAQVVLAAAVGAENRGVAIPPRPLPGRGAAVAREPSNKPTPALRISRHVPFPAGLVVLCVVVVASLCLSRRRRPRRVPHVESPKPVSGTGTIAESLRVYSLVELHDGGTLPRPHYLPMVAGPEPRLVGDPALLQEPGAQLPALASKRGWKTALAWGQGRRVRVSPLALPALSASAPRLDGMKLEDAPKPYRVAAAIAHSRDSRRVRTRRYMQPARHRAG